MKKVMVVGSGGREHAIVWRIARDGEGIQIFCAPGNAGTDRIATNVPIAATDIRRLVDWAKSEKPDLVVVGPEAPLCAGLANRLRQHGFRVVGPDAEAARLEGSKLFAKQVMQAAGVPTARAVPFSDFRAAAEYVKKQSFPLVIKADGLAAGKGVTVAQSFEEAIAALEVVMVRKEFGEAGQTVLIEDYLVGEEASVLALVDGERIVTLPAAQDHKRALDYDRGPNTGGMGAYSPVPFLSQRVLDDIRERIFEATLRELRRCQIVYRGVLYAGLMITPEGPHVLEFNCRFGDPEAQVILRRFEGNFLSALEACAAGELRDDLVRISRDHCVCVVMAAAGYPGPYRKGDEIRGVEAAEHVEGVVVFHAGTERKDGKLVTAGGRVLNVTAVGGDLTEALDRAYGACECITFEGAHYRRDIGRRALAR